MHDDWTKHGSALLAHVRETNPAVYLRVVASLVPARLDIANVDEDMAAIDNMTADELRAFIASPLEGNWNFGSGGPLWVVRQDN